MANVIIIGYDGSLDARRAIDAAPSLTTHDALIVTVWHPVTPISAGAVPMAALPSPEADAALEEEARKIAGEGVARAEATGLRARPAVVRGEVPGRTGEILAELAEEHDAAAIVVGRRGVSRLEAVVLGSVSNATVRAARRPVLVVPAPDD